MIEHLRYVNSKGDEAVFGPGTCWEWGSHDLFDLSMEAKRVGGRITSMRRAADDRHLELRMVGGSREERNRIIDLISYDANVNVMGTLYAGESWMRCFISGFAQTLDRMRDSVIRERLTVSLDRPAWVRSRSFSLVTYERPSGDGLDYPHDYPHDYKAGETNSALIENPFQLPCKCDIAFPGPCKDPYVKIAGNFYRVDVEASKGQLVIIRGFGHPKPDVVIRSSDGTEQTVFNDARRTYGEDVFAEVPVGRHTATWSGTQNIELTLYEERTAPWYT